jgi:hypothetical protein
LRSVQHFRSGTGSHRGMSSRSPVSLQASCGTSKAPNRGSLRNATRSRTQTVESDVPEQFCNKPTPVHARAMSANSYSSEMVAVGAAYQPLGALGWEGPCTAPLTPCHQSGAAPGRPATSEVRGHVGTRATDPPSPSPPCPRKIIEKSVSTMTQCRFPSMPWLPSVGACASCTGPTETASPSFVQAVCSTL